MPCPTSSSHRNLLHHQKQSSSPSVTGVVNWEIDDRVKTSHADYPASSACPDNHLFVPANFSSLLLQWGHSPHLACLPGVRLTPACCASGFVDHFMEGMPKSSFMPVESAPSTRTPDSLKLYPFLTIRGSINHCSSWLDINNYTSKVNLNKMQSSLTRF